MEDNKYVDFMQEPVFVPLPLTKTLDVPRNRRIDRAIGWVLAVVCVGLAFWFFTNKSFRDFTNLGMLMTICIYATVYTFIASFILIKFVFKTDEKVTARSVEGTSNHKLALSEVWNISAGGVNTETFMKDMSGLIINYQGCPAFIYRTITGNIDGLGVGAEEVHYDCNQSILDLIMRSRCTRVKLNLKYATENDGIWDYTSQRIYEVADDVGQGYVNVMTSILKHQFEYTKIKSRVTSTYYIIKFSNNATLNEVVGLYSSILNLNSQGSINKVTLVSESEFQSLLQQYYGLQHIDTSGAMQKSTLVESIGDSKILQIKDLSSTAFKKDPTEVKIVGNFYDNPYVEVFNLPEDIAPIIADIDIFRD